MAGISLLRRVTEIRPGIVLAIAAIALAPIAVFAPNGTVVLLAVTGIVLAFDAGHRHAAYALLNAPAVRLIVALLVVAVLASFWAFDPLRGLVQCVRLALLAAAGFVTLAAALHLSPPDARVAQRGMAAGGLLLAGLMLIETASGAGLTQFFRGIDERMLIGLSNGAPLSRGGTVLALFLWPIFLAVRPWYGRGAVPALAAGAGVALWLQPVEATVIAAAAGAVVFVAARAAPAATARFGSIAVVVLLLAPPVVAALLPNMFDGADLQQMPQSHRHRVQIWTYALDRILERPVLGWGFDASREVMGTGAGAAFADAPMSLHTHNITLQAWLELGIGGVVLVVALGHALWRRAAALGAGVAPAALAGFVTWLVYAEISRGAWQTWWLAALWLFVVWLVALHRAVVVSLLSGSSEIADQALHRSIQ